MPSAFACGTDDAGEERTTSLVQSEGAALGGITRMAAKLAMGAWARCTPVAGAKVVALIKVSAPSSCTAISVPVMVPIAVGPIAALIQPSCTAISVPVMVPIAVGPIATLIQPVVTGSVALDVARGELVIVNIPIIG